MNDEERSLELKFIKTKILISALIMLVASGCGSKGLVEIIKASNAKIRTLEQDITTTNKLLTEIKTQKEDVEKVLEQEHAKVEKLKVELQKRKTIQSLSNEDLVALAQSEGVSAEIRGSYVLAIINQVKVQLSYNERNHLLFARTIFNGIDNVILANNINSKVEFGRAYVSRSSLVFEAYVNLKEGVKPKFLQNWFSTWKKHVILLKRGLIQYVQSQQAASRESSEM